LKSVPVNIITLIRPEVSQKQKVAESSEASCHSAMLIWNKSPAFKRLVLTAGHTLTASTPHQFPYAGAFGFTLIWHG
jgi:hypothetical protein